MVDPERLLALYRDANGPSRAAEQRMLEALHVQFGSAAGGTTTGGTTATGTTATGGAALASKLAVVLIVASSGAALVLALAAGSRARELASGDSEERPLLVEPASSPALDAEPEPELPLRVEPELAPAPEPRVSEPLRGAEGARTRTRARSRHPAATPLVDEGPLGGEGLASEAKLLREADAALRRGALADARQLLDEHGRRFSQPILADEAELLARLLDCQDGRPDADALARRYLDAHPSSPAAGRIAAKCTLE